jgi:Protein of unknown function (DUF664)
VRAGSPAIGFPCESANWDPSSDPRISRWSSSWRRSVHVIEEYARHNGHTDLIRERIDGVTGD